MRWFESSVDEVLSLVNSSLGGLSSTEARRRLESNGPNIVLTRHSLPFYRLLLAQFKSFMPWLLLGLALLAFLAAYFFEVKTHYFDTIVLLIIVAFNTFMGAYQQHTANKHAKNLDELSIPLSLVLRDGLKQELPRQKIVTGDIIYLSTGMKVPADARLIEAHHLELDESLLTGESFPVLKNAYVIEGDHSIFDQHNMIFRDTYVRNGAGVAVVVATGSQTQVGKISTSLKPLRISAFNREIDEATNKVTMMATMMIFVVLLVSISDTVSWTELILLATALLISAIPESLPSIVTFSVSHVAHKLSSSKILVRRHSFIETTGSVDVLCLDKTGTITSNKLRLSYVYVDGDIATSFMKLSQIAKTQFSYASLLANEAHRTDKGYVGDSVDIAFIDYFNEKDFDIIELQEEFPRINFEPFSSSTMILTSKHRIGSEIITYAKGSPENILANCTHVLLGSKELSLTPTRRISIDERLDESSSLGLKNIALSYQSKEKVVFIGFVGLVDPLKPGIHETLESFQSAGIQIKVLTGDALTTSIALLRSCGLTQQSAVDWQDIKDYSSDKLSQTINNFSVFARVTPEGKLMIVRVLKESGRRVAFIGDGVNDVPALQESSVAISMGKRSSDMTKDSSDIIILDDNLDSVTEVIKQGRGIYDNMRKVLAYLLTANLAEIFLVIIGAFYGVMPFLAIQLLWVSFVTSYAPALGLSVDPPLSSVMKRKPSGVHETLVNKQVISKAVMVSVKKAALLIILFFGALSWTGDLIFSQTIAFTWLVLWHIVRIVSIRFEEGSSIFANKLVVAALIVPVLAQLVILYSPVQTFFRVVPLPWEVWLVMVCAMGFVMYLDKAIPLLAQKKFSKKSHETV